MRIARLIILLVPLAVILCLGLVFSTIGLCSDWLNERCREWFDAIWKGI